jgi:DNA replication protein DnaC
MRRLTALPEAMTRISEAREAARLQREAHAAAHGLACADCADTGTTYAHKRCGCAAGQRLAAAEAAARLEALEQALDGALEVPPLYRGLTLDTFADPASPVLAVVRAWVQATIAGALREDNRCGLYLHGNLGVGKTGLACAALREVVRHSGAHTASGLRECGLFTTATTMLQGLRPQREQWAAEQWQARLLGVRVLALDDMGAERTTVWGAEREFEVVNHRHNQRLPLLITSNWSLDELAVRINEQAGTLDGDRIVERLMVACRVVRFDAGAPNWRLQPAQR